MTNGNELLEFSTTNSPSLGRLREWMDLWEMMGGVSPRQSVEGFDPLGMHEKVGVKYYHSEPWVTVLLFSVVELQVEVILDRVFFGPLDDWDEVFRDSMRRFLEKKCLRPEKLVVNPRTGKEEPYRDPLLLISWLRVYGVLVGFGPATYSW